MSSAPRLVTPGNARRRRGRIVAPAAAVGIHRPGAGACESERVHRSRTGAQGGARSCAVRRPSRPGQDHIGADSRARIGRQFPRHVRPGDRQGGRPRSAADESRAARRAVHRRDPPAQPSGRGNTLSGDGRFPARPDHRRRPGRAFGEDRSVALHPDRRYDARGAADQSAARQVRHSGAAEFLFRERTRGNRQSGRARARHRHRARRRQRGRAACPRHAAHCWPPAAARARFRACRGCQNNRPQGRRSRAVGARS